MAISYGLLQLIAVGITTTLVMTIQSGSTWFSVFIALGLSHYFLAIYYARHRAIGLVKQPHSWVPALLLCAAGTALYKLDFPLIWYFLLHHIFNEVYLRQNFCPLGDPDKTASIRGVSLAFHTVAYLVLLDGRWYQLENLMIPLLALLGCLFAIYISMIARRRKSLSYPVIFNNISLELIVLALLPVALVAGITFRQLVCYHFVFWALVPLLRARQSGTRWLMVYSALAIGSTILFLVLSPMKPIDVPFNFSGREFNEQFQFWSYVHITLAFATSSAFPFWIRRWFEQRPAVAN
jgi:hypothetical protein